MAKLYKPKKLFKQKLDEQLSIDYMFHYVEISDKGVVRVWNYFADKYVNVNKRGYFRATPKQLANLKKKLIEVKPKNNE